MSPADTLADNFLAKARLEVSEIKRFLPHRDPFLMVDRVLEIQLPAGVNTQSAIEVSSMLGARVVAEKDVLLSEPHFAGHFPGMPIMPGVLLIETMAQVSSFTVYPHWISAPPSERETIRCMLVGTDSARFRKPVVPGDVLSVESTLTKLRSIGGAFIMGFDCKTRVGGAVVSEAQIMAQLIFNTHTTTNTEAK